jgi:predicted nucleic acid-binding protein
MILSEALGEIKTIFLDTAPIIYFIEAHHEFGPLVKQVVELMNASRIQAFTSVLTLSEVLPKPVETGNDELAEKFKTYLKNGPNLTLLPIGETSGSVLKICKYEGRSRSFCGAGWATSTTTIVPGVCCG